MDDDKLNTTQPAPKLSANDEIPKRQPPDPYVQTPPLKSRKSNSKIIHLLNLLDSQGLQQRSWPLFNKDSLLPQNKAWASLPEQTQLAALQDTMSEDDFDNIATCAGKYITFLGRELRIARNASDKKDGQIETLEAHKERLEKLVEEMQFHKGSRGESRSPALKNWYGADPEETPNGFCPTCDKPFEGMTLEEALDHANWCLDERSVSLQTQYGQRPRSRQDWEARHAKSAYGDKDAETGPFGDIRSRSVHRKSRGDVDRRGEFPPTNDDDVQDNNLYDSDEGEERPLGDPPKVTEDLTDAYGPGMPVGGPRIESQTPWMQRLEQEEKEQKLKDKMKEAQAWNRKYRHDIRPGGGKGTGEKLTLRGKAKASPPTVTSPRTAQVTSRDGQGTFEEHPIEEGEHPTDVDKVVDDAVKTGEGSRKKVEADSGFEDEVD